MTIRFTLLPTISYSKPSDREDMPKVLVVHSTARCLNAHRILPCQYALTYPWYH